MVVLPGLFDVDLLGELTGEDPFLGPMRTAIINKDVQSFNKLGAYMAQIWTNAAVVNNCVLLDNNLAIPEQLRSAILSRLHRSHPETGGNDGRLGLYMVAIPQSSDR